jgi:gamma-glutamylcyclotransferase (GGCT)/AIG2-like uncharacterized protein YtfP
MDAVFIFNNLKVDTFHLKDAPFPGFEILTWEHESFLHGTLWDLGVDAGYTEIGLNNVYGQIWITEYPNQLLELNEFLGYPNITSPKRKKVTIHSSADMINEELDCIVYTLNTIKSEYKIIKDGKWQLKRL